MTSMLCQKSKTGIISPHDKALFNYVLYSDDTNSIFKASNNKLFERSFYDVDDSNRLSSCTNPGIVTTTDDYYDTIPNNNAKTPPSTRITNSNNSNDVILYKRSFTVNNNEKRKSSSNNKDKRKFLSSNTYTSTTTTTARTSTVESASNTTSSRSSSSSSNSSSSTKSSTATSQQSDSVNKKSSNSSSRTTKIVSAPPSIVYPPPPTLKNKIYPSSAKLSAKKISNINNLMEESSDFHKKFDSMLKEEKILNKINHKTINEQEWQKNRKREIIYKNWHINVYEPIKTEINKGMNSQRADLIRNLRNLKYLEYLNQVNKYGAAFREDFEPLEYNPTCDGMLNLDVCVATPLKDPTLLPIRKKFKEESLLYRCITGFDLTKSEAEKIKLPTIQNCDDYRNIIDWKDWVLEEYNSIDSSVRVRSAIKCNPLRQMNTFNIDPEKDLLSFTNNAQLKAN